MSNSRYENVFKVLETHDKDICNQALATSAFVLVDTRRVNAGDSDRVVFILGQDKEVRCPNSEVHGDVCVPTLTIQMWSHRPGFTERLRATCPECGEVALEKLLG